MILFCTSSNDEESLLVTRNILAPPIVQVVLQVPVARHELAVGKELAVFQHVQARHHIMTRLPSIIQLMKPTSRLAISASVMRRFRDSSFLAE
jgi:hypothetical protein